ncbi:MAG TPA: ATP-binding protein [Acidiferrobacter sp.]|nr:ATP-binding protein [Acidiferrobacter sp.]
MFRSLSNRLIIAILAVAFLFGILGALFISRLGDIGDVTGMILQSNSQSLATVADMREASIAYGLSMKSKTRARAIARFADAMARARSEVSTPAAYRILTDLARAWSADQRWPDAAHFARLRSDMNTLTALMHQTIATREARAARAIKELTIFAGLGLFISLFIILVLSVWMVRIILSPMHQLARSIHELSPSGVHRELERSGLSEFDSITKEFNSFLRRLEKHERGNTDRLVYENAKIDALINSIDDGLVLLDRQGKILHVNFMAGMLLQAEPKELLGRNINDLNIATRFYINIRNALVSLRREDQDEPQYSRNEFSLTIRGRLHSYILKTVPFRDRGRSTMGLIVVLQDVTELRHAEHQRSQLLATLSHELKTPLASLSLSIGELYEVAQKEAYPQQTRRLLDVGKEEVERLTMLVEDLLDVSRPDATRTSIDLKRFELCEFLKRQTHSFRLQADLRDVDMIVTCVPDLILNADPVKLGWVFNNLLSNALRHTPSHGQITVSAAIQDQDDVVVQVTDTGQGIPPQELPSIFEWRTQGVTDAQGSAGMGLAIVREMVEAHGGHITVESKVGEGTRFQITLPRHMTEAELPLQPIVPLPGED